MKGYAFYLVVLMGVIVSYGQSQSQTTAGSTICWDTTWFNSSAPTKTNRSEYEQQSAKVLDSICSQGSIIAARCEDSKGESFTGFRNDTVIKYIARCDVINGLICNPYNVSKDSICPDFQIQYGCTCPSTTPNFPVGGSSANGNSNASEGSGSGLRGGGGNGGSGTVGTTRPGSGKNTGSGNSGSGTGSGTGHSKGASGNGVQKTYANYLLLTICVFLKL